MSGWGKYLVAGLLAAIVTHVVVIHAAPRLMMNVALKQLSEGRYNAWRIAPRVTPASRTIVRPSPDFAYSACPYDLSEGPVTINVAPWDEYWSISLYAANSDNFFVLDDREVRGGAQLVVARRNDEVDAGAQRVNSPSRRGIALIRRLAPTSETYAAAAQVAERDVCATQATLAN